AHVVNFALSQHRSRRPYVQRASTVGACKHCGYDLLSLGRGFSLPFQLQVETRHHIPLWNLSFGPTRAITTQTDQHGPSDNSYFSAYPNTSDRIPGCKHAALPSPPPAARRDTPLTRHIQDGTPDSHSPARRSDDCNQQSGQCELVHHLLRELRQVHRQGSESQSLLHLQW
ncbi:hypothetical protein DOTSEDRAFT_74954, partial [Dothistroma septosporum NZE10]